MATWPRTEFVRDELVSSRTNLRSSRRCLADPIPTRSPPRLEGRTRQLRQEVGLTIEKLVYESEVRSKGYLSEIEKGLAFPTVSTLQRIAAHLGVDLLDLVTFPEGSPRQELVALTRNMKPRTVRKLVREATQDSKG